METNKRSFKQIITAHLSEIISLVILGLTAAAFCTWLFTKDEVTVQGVVAAALCAVIFELALIVAVPRAIRFFKGEQETAPVDLMGERSKIRTRLHPLLRVFLTVLASRVIVILLAYLMSLLLNGYKGTIFQLLKPIWYKLDTDAVHYANIAENWYSTDFPDAWALVFLPLYPLCIRAANFIFHDSFVSGFVLNLLFSSAAGAVIYELALRDLGRRSSRFAVFCAFALPAAIFSTAPMSEPLFILLTASALLCLRKEKFILAAVFGALASFTRSLGVILLLPFAAEGAAYCVRLYKSVRDESGKKAAVRKLWGAMIKLAVGALILFSGTGAYLLINKLLWGDWFKFMQLQKENWYQSMGWFFNTASYQTERLFKEYAEGDVQTVVGLWLPNLLFIFGALVVFVSTARYLRTSYVLYFAAYFAVAIGATWLLSAPRYLTALIILPIAIAKLCESRDDGVGIVRARGKAFVVSALLLIGQFFYLAFYVMRYKLY